MSEINIDEVIIKEISKMDNLTNEEKRVQMEYIKVLSDLKKIDSDSAIRNREVENGKNASYRQMGFDIAKVCIPLLFYGSWMVKCLKFEEEGVMTSQTFKSLLSKALFR